MKFSIFSHYLHRLETTASRNQMTVILAELFQQAEVKEIDKICYLFLGRLAPKYKDIEFNMADKTMIKAIAKALKKEATEIEIEYKKRGDLGEIIISLESGKNKPLAKFINKDLTVLQVYRQLFDITQEKGIGSSERKINMMAKLLLKLNPLSAKYIVRVPINKLRLGFSDMTVLDALSWWRVGDKSLRPDLEKAFNVLADIGEIARIFKTKGIKGIKGVKGNVGVPIRAAKAERLSSPKEILAKMGGKCALEPKYDGFRVNIHLDKKRNFLLKEKTNLNLFKDEKKFFVRIFSRNLENITNMFPEIIEAAQKLKVKSAIFDGEAIAFNPQTKEILPFQETIKRKRKYGISKKAKEIPLKVFIFDLLYLNGHSLLLKPLKRRRYLLEKIFVNQKNQDLSLILTPQKIVNKVTDFNFLFNKAAAEGLEGLMAKKLDAPYQAGTRNFNWVKYKVAMQSELADTIDCVVMGYYKGKGRRTSLGIGAFLAGIYHKGKFLTVSKIGTGLTDKQWKRIFKSLTNLRVQSRPKEYIVHKNLYPDVWCRPELVVEIEADTITKSPIHTAGLAFRFPRLKKFRDDKNAQEATTLKELKKLAGIKRERGVQDHTLGV